ncbi:barstar family protein [Streptomyces nigra]|uniref:barstar family protein n=1 Tax=Streptomyces nigra TaxID=1827580 RepID=UPI0036317C9B
MDRFFSVDAEEFRAPLLLDRLRVEELIEAAKLRGLGVFRLDGAQMVNQASLFQEFKIKLQFPEYFGGNWNALDECLADLAWLDRSGYLLVIESEGSLLCDEEPDVREMLGELLRDLSGEWSDSDPPVIFRTVLVVDG